jgi:hypothetical protein
MMRMIDSKDRAASIALLLMGIGMAILYPKNLLIGQAGWIWDYPNRHLAFEHMLVAVYVTLGLFLIWAARDPVRFVPLINFAIVSGAVHATAMLVDACDMPGMHNHLGWRGDVVGTYLAPFVLTVFHPDRQHWRRYFSQRLFSRSETS